MHISEGVLSAPVLLGGAALALAGTAKGLKDIGEDEIPRAALLAAVFFIASLIHVNIGPVSAHLILSGLIGLFLGWGAFPVILAGLLLQGVLFQYGGLTVLGVNAFDMALPAALLGRALKGAVTGRRFAFAAAFVCGGGSLLASALLTALALYLSGREFGLLALGLFTANWPIALIEGFMCAFTVAFLAKVRPGALAGPARSARAARAPGARRLGAEKLA